MIIKITYLTKSQNVKTNAINTEYVHSTDVDQELGTISFLIDGQWIKLLCTNIIGIEYREQGADWTEVAVEKDYDCGEMQYALEAMVWDNKAPKSIGETAEN